MRISRSVFVLIPLVGMIALAQSGSTTKFDARLSVHTLVREDIFAGFLGDNMERLSQGEKNLEQLLIERPASRADLLAWQGGARLYRSVNALKAGRQSEYEAEYKIATDLFAEAKKTPHQMGGVEAVTGGTYSIFADRLAPQHRAAGWTAAYDAYQSLWKGQGEGVASLPPHLQGELLAGVAMSAQRTGRAAETQTYLDRIIQLMPGTAYANRAKQWKDNPASATQSSIVCQSCHEPGRLATRRAALPPQQ